MKLLKVVGVLAMSLLPAIAAAQSATSSSIAGVVKDTTGAVLPGVTVEAASPALIEKVRTVVTDGDGNYKILELRPGTYTVTFTLTGFGTVKREGIVLTSGFTAAINADLKVGGLEETVTVSGASPLVDVQNARVQKVLERELLDSAPTSSMSPDAFSALTVGLSSDASGHDVGGSMGERGGAPGYHGLNVNDSKLLQDGMEFNSLHGIGGGSYRLYRGNTLAAGEINLGLGAQGAESSTSGVQVNYVPRDGGNKLSLTSNLSYADKKWASSNLDSDLQARGLRTVGKLLKSWDYGVGVGGPVKTDKLWFFGAPRMWGNDTGNPGGFYNATQHTRFYTPDLNNPANQHIWYWDLAGRITWQATDKDKITFNDNHEHMCLCTFSASPTLAPEFLVSYHIRSNLSQATWTRPQTNKLLFKAGYTFGKFISSTPASGDVADTDISVIDVGAPVGTLLYGAPAGQTFSTSQQSFISKDGRSYPLNMMFSAAYVTGSHAAKFGTTWSEGWHIQNATVNQGLQYIFFNKFPVSLTQYATPFNESIRTRARGFYGQDQWTLKKLTLNYGARIDLFQGWVLPQTIPAGPFVAERTFGKVENVPNWKDFSPRLNAAYDVFGNGKTAVKASYGRYVASEGAGLTELNNPAQTMVTAASRSWFDANQNYIPDECNLRIPTANGTCGPLSDQAFGTLRPSTFYADDVLHGWGKRGYTWQTSVGLDQELIPGLSVSGAYFRNTYGNILAQVNTAVAASDFTTYCVTAPTDSRLPTSGSRICGLYDINPAKFGQVHNEIKPVEDLGIGDVTRVYNSVDITMQGRFKNGAQLSGGTNIGRTSWNDCAMNSLPQAYLVGAAWVANAGDSSTGGTPHPRNDTFCTVQASWMDATQFKLNGVVPLPYGFQVSGVFQSLPGAPIRISRGGPTCALAVCASYSTAEIATSLGRPLSGNVTSLVIPITVPETIFEKRLNQLDFRATREFKLRATTLKANVDLYNAFNANYVTGVSGSYARTAPTAANPRPQDAFLTPTTVMGARFVRLTGQIEF